MTSLWPESQLIEDGRAVELEPARLDYALRGTPLVVHVRGDARIVDAGLAEAVEIAALQAADLAHAEGLAQGYREGREVIEKEMCSQYAIDRRRDEESVAQTIQVLHTTIRTFESAISRVESLHASHYEQTGAQIGDVVYALVEALLGRELEADRIHVIDALGRAVGQLPQGSPLQVRLHPAAITTLNEHGIDLAEFLSREVRIHADDSIEPGCAVVNSEFCHVDARLRSALDRLKKAISS